MPRRPRIETPGYYHIVNRGVERRKVFLNREDFETFEYNMCIFAEMYDITIHNYCLMSNHYHILLENINQNISKFMRQLNMNYAIYFNKKYKRTGHLWQGRYKSWYVTDEYYLHMLMRYIEQNPLKAKMVTQLETYPYNSFSHFISDQPLPKCLTNSWIANNFKNDKKSIKLFLCEPISSELIQEQKKASLLALAPDTKPKSLTIEEIQQYFQALSSKEKRDKMIVELYKNQNCSQHKIAQALHLNQATINRIIKKHQCIT